MSDPHRMIKFSRSPIPRSRSDFCYVNLTPTAEKRKTTDFSHLLPQFNRDPPYVRLLDSKVAIVDQPTSAQPTSSTTMCRSATGHIVAKSPTLEVIRSQSMRSLRRTLEMSPTKYRCEENTAKKENNLQFHQNSIDVKYEMLDKDVDKDLTRLRNFSMTNKGLVNWGDSFRSRSMPFVPVDRPSSSSDMRASSSVPTCGHGVPRSATTSACSARSPTRYRIVILGSSNVGKTTMIKQFRTSEYICAFDGGSSSNEDNNDYAITVVLNGEESDLEFIDSCSLEEETEDEANEDAVVQAKPYIPTADAYVVVYSVTSRRSFLHGLKLVSRVQNVFLSSVVLLVGNKSDLVRIRAVTTDEGRVSAKERNCRFLETSVAINHQVDELLVTILTELRTMNHMCGHAVSKMSSPHHCSLNKAKGLLKKLLKKACFQSKSCDNLQRL